ncbi:hypothetical protein HPB47_011246 [Ixodes persulcatus]|uniref:Uncharacterized protein n=1 Tax=Ixodes persulcatus TaxID=34615 RepID=A0AC60NX08_IXOPE|nr:hypothetical protein HPB47_011246 [Ixodes persulcatus]
MRTPAAFHLILYLVACGRAQVEDYFAEQTVTRCPPFSGLISREPRKVNVTVFYESYSRDSKRFVTRQLWPTYRRLRDHVSLELVPYGNARMQGSTSDGGAATFFIACTLRNHDPASAVWKCAGDVMDMVPQKIMSCVNSLQGKKAVSEDGYEDLGDIQHNLKASICGHFKSPMPRACQPKAFAVEDE